MVHSIGGSFSLAPRSVCDVIARIAGIFLLVRQFAFYRSSLALRHGTNYFECTTQQPTSITGTNIACTRQQRDAAPIIRIFSATQVDTATSRAARFPTIDERVRVYMGDWYHPPCGNNDTITFRWNHRNQSQEVVLRDHFGGQPITADVLPDTLVVLDFNNIVDCSHGKARLPTTKQIVKANKSVRPYCKDIAKRMLPLLHRHNGSATPIENAAPVLLQFGDKRRSHNFGPVHVPHFKKVRYSRGHSGFPTACRSSTPSPPPQPIIWELNTYRHYGLIPQVPIWDVPWERKVDVAVFRGQLTGRGLDRFRAVRANAGSRLVDASLTGTRGRLPDVLEDGTRIVGNKKSVKDLLRYKAIVMMEGNDVASGLKWALFSQSVVMMPPPSYTSWAMEELLEPWVHYVPIDNNGSNIEQRMEWVIQNDSEAKRIAQRGSMWIKDLLFHEDSSKDARLIEAEMLRRYSLHFQPSESNKR